LVKLLFPAKPAKRLVKSC